MPNQLSASICCVCTCCRCAHVSHAHAPCIMNERCAHALARCYFRYFNGLHSAYSGRGQHWASAREEVFCARCVTQAASHKSRYTQ